MSDGGVTGHGVVTMEWADGVYTFRLDYGAIFQLQEKLDMGPPELLFVLQAGKWKVQHIAETIRCGLVGGGMSPVQAIKMVKLHVHDRPYEESRHVAEILLKACLYSPKPIDLTKADEAPGEQPVATENATSENSTLT